MDDLRSKELNKLFSELHDFIGIEHYNIFFESEEEEIDTNLVGPTFFSFSFLKIIDSALKYSKKRVYEKFKNNNFVFDNSQLLEESIFPDGSKLGFYNCSKYDLDSLSECVTDYTNVNDFIKHEKEFRLKIDDYVNNFDENILKILKKLDFDKILDNLQHHDILSTFIKKLNSSSIPKKYFDSRVSFLKTIDSFIDLFIERGEPYNIFFGNTKEDINTAHTNKILSNLLVQLLFNNINLKEYDSINIYNPSFNNIDLLESSRNFINEVKSDCNVKLYGKFNIHDSIVEFTKLTMYSLLNDEPNLLLSDSNKHDFPFRNISEKDIDFIISDFRLKNVPYVIFENQIKKQMTDSLSKAVILLEKTQFFKDIINNLILDDLLESIITFNEEFILIINPNKPIELKDKFILIDDTINGCADLEYLEKHEETFKMEIEYIVDCYNALEDTDISKVIYSNAIDKPYEYNGEYEYEFDYHKDIMLFDGNDILEFDKNNSHVFRKINNNEIEAHKRTFVFNHLMYDKKRVGYSKIKENYLGNEKTEFFEENLEFIPLMSIIVLDETEIDDENTSKNEIEIFGKSFFIKSDLFLKEFLEYYFESENGIEEFNYFKEGLGFKSNDVIFMRIPVLSIETQKDIIKTKQIIEEHYNLINELRDNFKSNIFSYEEILKDIDKLNIMKLDLKK